MRRLSLRTGLGLAAVAFASLVLAVTVAIGSDDPQPVPVAGIQNIMISLDSGLPDCIVIMFQLRAITTALPHRYMIYSY